MDFPVEEFLKARSFSVQDNCIEWLHEGKKVEWQFDSEAAMLQFLKEWSRRSHQTPGGASASGDTLLAPITRSRAYV